METFSLPAVGENTFFRCGLGLSCDTNSKICKYYNNFHVGMSFHLKIKILA